MDAASEIADLRAKLAERDAELATAHHLIDQYKAQLHKLRRMKFGQSSEALDAQIHQRELWLEDLKEFETTAHATAASNRPERCQPVRKPLPDHLPREAHARRKLFDEFERTKSSIAEEALRRIGKLYDIEADITGHSVELRKNPRQGLAVPILDGMKNWCHDQGRRLSSKSNLAKALQYALTRWDAIALYTTNGRVGIDNNPAERSLRGIAVTRKNFLFLGSEAGGERAAVLYTVLETAKLNGINPEAYLTDVIDHRPKDIQPIASANYSLGIGSRKKQRPSKPSRLLADAYLRSTLSTSVSSSV